MPPDTKIAAGVVRVTYPQDIDSAASWAHVSGWAQLSGERQTVSCLISTFNEAPALSGLLPELSDVLTECGYPWEVIVVDAASSDGTERLLKNWSEIPGFRSIILFRNFGKATAIATGLEASRGDAVILLETNMRRSINSIPYMISRWESGLEIVHAGGEGPGDLGVPTGSDPSVLEGLGESSRPFELAAIPSELVLLDRRLVNTLLR